ncbi:MAG: undecaprenyl-diphosphatase UppP [Elusimicrobia bacterium RIFCSPLOWO2_01_FULL_60_11]|nr:MAG: undecaprenyl-diphosphatase UppP [Elusimicrobia bacterium RIFCSPLOWO2_01_FULL_60_11]
MGLVEGVTEFLPVSSTGHLIIAGHFLGFEGGLAQSFEIFIQLGAILAVLILYWKKFLDPAVLKLLFWTTLPALGAGALAHPYIKAHLFNPATVAMGLFAGGAVMIGIEKVLPPRVREGIELLTVKDALWIGGFQCLALWPGISRSGATLIGGMALGVSRKTAAEYSFLAAVPVIFAATALDLWESRSILNMADAPLFTVGFVTAFVSAILAVKWLVRHLSGHPLTAFGWYRVMISPFIFYFSK